MVRFGDLLHRKAERLWTIGSYFYHTKRNTSGADIDPWKVFWVDPARITHCTVPRFDVNRRTGGVVGGQWDLGEVVKTDQRTRFPFEELVFYRSLERHFLNGVDWEETELFRYVLNEDGFEQASRYDSPSEFLKRCEEIDAIYDNIEANGYRKQIELLEGDVDDIGGWGADRVWEVPPFRRYRELNEVSVNIGRDGELLFNSRGHHRLSISKILEVSEIPVRVVVRHRKWQGLREGLDEALATADAPVEMAAREHLRDQSRPEEFAAHPDLRAILERHR